MKTFLSVLGVVLVLGFAVLATGCNTIDGMGRDVESAGEAIQGGAN